MQKIENPLENRDGVLYIDGANTIELAKEFGTPLYVYSKNRIRENYKRLLNAFQKRRKNYKLFYAIKANNSISILKILKEVGAGVDASGPAEIMLAQKAGFKADKILYTGNYQSDEELKFAFESKVMINLDDISLLPRLLKFGTPEFLSFRINPGIGKGKFKQLIFAGPDAKFGVPENKVIEAYKLAKEAGIKRFGIHMMTGSCILDPEYFELITKKMLEIVENVINEIGIKFEFIDLGGSLGVPYSEEEKELDIEEVAEKVVNVFKEKEEKLGLKDCFLVNEPGRYLLGDAGILLARVDAIKESEKKYIGTDAGMNTLLRPAFYGAYHRILLANDLERKGKENVDVTGKICENSDRLAKDRVLPIIKTGDLLAVMTTGAYGFGMSSQYNTRPKAAEVLVSDGKARLIRKRETFDDITRNMIF